MVKNIKLAALVAALLTISGNVFAANRSGAAGGAAGGAPRLSGKKAKRLRKLRKKHGDVGTDADVLAAAAMAKEDASAKRKVSLAEEMILQRKVKELLSPSEAAYFDNNILGIASILANDSFAGSGTHVSKGTIKRLNQALLKSTPEDIVAEVRRQMSS